MPTLDNLLATFDDRVEDALAAAGDLLVTEAALRAPKRSGDLRRSIRRHGLEVVVEAPYGAFVENGRPAITAAQGKALRFEINGQVIFARRVKAVRARPFMAPAVRIVERAMQRLFDRAMS